MLLPSRKLNPYRDLMTGDERVLQLLLWDGILRQAGSSDADPLTQEELASRTSLSRNSIKAYTSDKLNSVLQKGNLSLQPEAGFALGVDFGHTHEVRVVLTDLRGRWDPEHGMSPAKDEFRDTPDPRAWDTVNIAVDRIWEVMSSHLSGPVDPEQLVGVGIGIPTPSVPTTTPLDSAYGRWGHWGDAGGLLKEALEKRWRKETERDGAWSSVDFIDENDTNLSAIADHLWGGGPSADYVLYVKWQSSVRAALILNGELYTGSEGVAGELPHVKVAEASATCDFDSCPVGEGCLYAIAPIETFAEIAGSTRAKSIVERAAEDPKVRQRLELAARGIGQAVAPLALGLNPEKVVIGGALGSRAYPMVLEELSKGVGIQARARDFLVTSSTIRNRGTARGAAALALLKFAPSYLKRKVVDASANGSGRRSARTKARPTATSAR